MDGIIQLLVPLVIVVLSLVLSNSRRRSQQRDPEKRVEGDTPVADDGDAAPPPFMEDFPFATELEEMVTEQDADETEAVPEVSEEPEPPAPQETTPPVEEQRPQPPPVPVEARAGIRSLPGTSLLDLSPKTFRQGIVLREILERPRSRRTRRK